MVLHYLRIDDDPVFRRVIVQTAIRGETIVYWELRREFQGLEPYTYIVEANKDFNDDAGWRVVSDPVVNQLSTAVRGIHVTGHTIRSAFRVKLTTADSREYVSKPATDQGVLTEKQWMHYRSAFRRLTMSPRNVAPLQVTILKRRWFGPWCDCRNEETGEIGDITCLQCYGTGIVGGYWIAGQSRLIDISTTRYAARRDPNLMRGTTDVLMSTAIVAGLPPVEAEDVIVRRDVDRRYYVRSMTPRAEIAGIAVIAQIELGTIDFDDVIYQFEV